MDWVEEDEDTSEQYTKAFHEAVESLRREESRRQNNKTELIIEKKEAATDWVESYEDIKNKSTGETEQVLLYQIGPTTEWWQGAIQLPREVTTEDIAVGIWSLNQLELLQCNISFLIQLEYDLSNRHEFLTRYLFAALNNVTNKSVLETMNCLEALRTFFRNGTISMSNISCAFVSKYGNVKSFSGMIRCVPDLCGNPSFMITFLRINRNPTGIMVPYTNNINTTSTTPTTSGTTLVQNKLIYNTLNNNNNNNKNNNTPNHNSNYFPQTSSITSSLSSTSQVVVNPPCPTHKLPNNLSAAEAKNNQKKISKRAIDLRFRFYQGPGHKRKLKNEKISP